MNPNRELIVSIAQRRAQTTPDQNYVTYLRDGESDEVTMSYGELDERARQIAAWLQQRGIAQGSCALLILSNSNDFIQCFFGCLYAGIIVVPLFEPANSQQVSRYVGLMKPLFQITTPSVVITDAELVEAFQQETTLLFSPSAPRVVAPQTFLTATANSYRAPLLGLEDIAYLQFTSGSTGIPKGSIIRHHHLLSSLRQNQQHRIFESDEIFGSWLPLFHDFGLIGGPLGMMYGGGRLIQMKPVDFIKKPARWLEMLSKYRCTSSGAPHFAFEFCRRRVSAEVKQSLDLSSLRSLFNGSEPIHYEAMEAFIESFAECQLSPRCIRPGYGMAETVLMFTMSYHLSRILVDAHALTVEQRIVEASAASVETRSLVNCGDPIPEHIVLITDPETRRVLAPGEIGEIMMQGPCVTGGYYQNPEATAVTFHVTVPGYDGVFLRTGDLGCIYQGSLFVTGRIKDMIIIRGRNYYPQDIEVVVSNVDGIRLGCVAAFSIENADQEEELSLAMEVQPDLLKLSDDQKNARLTEIDQTVLEVVGSVFKIQPTHRIYIEPGSIDKTSSGKIKRQASKQKFLRQNFPKMVACFSPVNPADASLSHLSVPTTTVLGSLQQLFLELTQQSIEPNIPCVEVGSDSIAVASFFDAVCQKYPVIQIEAIDEKTTLDDLAQIITESKKH